MADRCTLEKSGRRDVSISAKSPPEYAALLAPARRPEYYNREMYRRRFGAASSRNYMNMHTPLTPKPGGRSSLI